jgi:Protein of unknown function (DUF3987)
MQAPSWRLCCFTARKIKMINMKANRSSCNSRSSRKPAMSAAWSEPDWSVYEDRRGDLPPFPIEVFTSPWQDLLKRASLGAGVLVDHVAVPLLGVGSSLIGTARRVQASTSWTVPMTLWTGLVAASGDGKTPGLNVSRRALDRIEEDSADTVSRSRHDHETRRQMAKEARQRWEKQRKEALAANPPQQAPPFPSDVHDPGNFIYPRLYTTDASVPSLSPLLIARPRGIMLIRDELSGHFARMATWQGIDRAFWLEAWDGNRHVVQRVRQEASWDIPHLLVGVIGGFQPDKVARAFAGDEDGMYARFLFGYPTSPDYRPLSNEANEVEPELYRALKALIQLPSENADGQFTAQNIHLSDAALARFEEFRRYIAQTKRQWDGREQQWLVKGETQVLRLAGTLAYLAWAIALAAPGTGIAGITSALEPNSIDEQAMVSAIRLWQDYFWPHARAVLRQIGLSQRHANARRALRWIKANDQTEVSLEDIRREALGQSLDAQQTRDLLNGLVKTGWLHEDVTPTKGRPLHRWHVNPRLNGTAGTAGTAERSNTNAAA